MKAAIFFTSQFGSTGQYADWIGEATGFPVFDLKQENPNPDDYELLILGSSVFIGRLTIRKWAHKNWPKIKGKPIILFSVSGTEPGHPDLQQYLEASLPTEMIEQMDYVALQGRLILEKLNWWIRLILKAGARIEKDEASKQRMSRGFDFMDPANIQPILGWVEKYNKKIEEVI